MSCIRARAVAQADNRGPNYNFYGAPCHIIVSYQRDEVHAFPDGSAAIQTMLLAAQSLGIATCWINQLRPLTDDPAIRPLLTQYGIPENHIVIGSIALGYAETETQPQPRKAHTITIIESSGVCHHAASRSTNSTHGLRLPITSFSLAARAYPQKAGFPTSAR